MPLAPEDVSNKQFTSTRLGRGYDEAEVDEFLDEVEAELRRLLGENDELRGKLAQTQRALSEAQARLARGEGGGAPDGRALAGAATERAATDGGEVTLVKGGPLNGSGGGVVEQPVVEPHESPEAVTQHATGILALAQRTAEQHVAEARAEADQILTSARDEAERLTAQSRAEADRVTAEARTEAEQVATAGHTEAQRVTAESRARADALIREAEVRREQVLGSLEHERGVLEHKVEELRAFERDYRSRLRAFIQDQLGHLDPDQTVSP